MTKNMILINSSWLLNDSSICKDFDNFSSVEVVKENAAVVRPTSDKFINLDKCIQLDKPQSDSDFCELKLTTNQHTVISITLLCSTNKIEIFTGPMEQYYKIIYGDLIAEDDDDSNYLFTINFPRSIKNIILKFISIKDKLWIYGMHTSLVESFRLPSSTTSTINFDNVNKILLDSNRDLSTDAKKCYEFLKDSLSQSNFSIENNLSNLHITDMVTDKNNGEQIKSNLTDDTLVLLKTYIDSKFDALEKSFSILFDRKMKELTETQNKKLDKILQLLEKE